MSLSELFQEFDGLGNNCEFGFAQEAGGYTVPTLFRACGFDTTDQIIGAIEAGLEGMFADGSFVFERIEGWPNYALRCRRYGIDFHTGLPIDMVHPPGMLKSRVVAFRFMKQKMLAELRSGRKIFVYRHKTEFDEDQADRLLASIRVHGPGSLLFVREDNRLEGRSAWVGASDRPGLVHAGMPRLWDENAPQSQIDHAAWETVARGALRLLRGRPKEPARNDRAAGPHQFDAGVADTAEAVIYRRLSAIFARKFGGEAVLAPELNVRDVPGWDSFKHVEMIVSIETEFDFRFQSYDIDETQTVGRLVRLIKRRRDGAEASGAAGGAFAPPPNPATEGAQ